MFHCCYRVLIVVLILLHPYNLKVQHDNRMTMLIFLPLANFMPISIKNGYSDKWKFSLLLGIA